jgi:hypothetical protein
MAGVVIVQNFCVISDISNVGGFHCAAGHVSHKLMNKLCDYSFEILLAFHVISSKAIEVTYHIL